MPVFAIPTDAPHVKGPPQGQWTYDDWLKLDTEHHRYRYEVIDGWLYVSYVPSVYHQSILQSLFRVLGIPLHDAKSPLLPFFYVGLIMPDAIVVPDFLIVHQRHVRWDTYIFGIPDLIAEVLYPGSPAYDEGIKLEAYAHAGVSEYAIIDPKARTLRYYKLIEPGTYADPHHFTIGESITFAVASNITVPIAALFDGTPDTTL
jgi:Uma2 family endonuclease